VLGLKEAENDSGKTINIHLPAPDVQHYLAPIDKFNKNNKPDVVIIRTRSKTCRIIIDHLGIEAFIPFENYRLDETALATFTEGPLQVFPAGQSPMSTVGLAE